MEDLLNVIENGTVNELRTTLFQLKSASDDSEWVKFINSCWDSCGLAPLHQAVQLGVDESNEKIAVLIEFGAAVNLRTGKGSTSLLYCCESRSFAAAKVLLDNGGDANISNSLGMTPLMMAVLQGDQDIVRLLLERDIEIDARRQDGNSALSLAAQKGDVEVLQLLCRRGADVNQSNSSDATPLYQACQNGKIAAVRFLVSAGADIDAANKYGGTPLFVAAQKGNSDIVTLLCENQANIHASNHIGMTSLHVASENGHSETVAVLIKHGASVNSEDHHGLVPLIAAVHNEHVEVIRQLIDAGADTGLLLKMGLTPKVTLCYLRENLDDLLAACETGDNVEVRAVLSRRFQNSSSDSPFDEKDGCALLWFCCQNHFHDICVLLVECGARINLLSEENPNFQMLGMDSSKVKFLNYIEEARHLFPLHVALRIGRSEQFIRSLMEVADMEPMDFHVVDYFGRTIFSLASEFDFAYSENLLADILSAALPIDRNTHVGMTSMYEFNVQPSEKAFSEHHYFPSCRLHVPISSSRVYFECTFITAGVNQVGVVLEGWQPETEDMGVGDDEMGVAIDGNRGGIWKDGSMEPLDQFQWKPGSIIGVEISIDEICQVSFSHDGEVIATAAMPISDGSRSTRRNRAALSVVPAITCSNGESVVFNFGETTFLHKPVECQSIFEYARGCVPGLLEFWDRQALRWKPCDPSTGFVKNDMYDWIRCLSFNRNVDIVDNVIRQNSRYVALLAKCRDELGREALGIASPLCRAALQRHLLLFGRYELGSGPCEHISKTAIVISAMDCASITKKKVVIKIMKNEDQFRRELQSREFFDSRFVVPVIDHYGIDACAEELSQKGFSGYSCCIVLPACDRTLQTLFVHERISTCRDWDDVRSILRQLTMAVYSLHSAGVIHGDVKPLNIVRTSSGQIQLIDLDSCLVVHDEFVSISQISASLSPKMRHRQQVIPSSYSEGKLGSCFIPPELVLLDRRIDLSIPSTRQLLLQNSPMFADVMNNESWDLIPDILEEIMNQPKFAHDIWSMGAVFYHLCTGENLFPSNDDDDIVDLDALLDLCAWTNQLKAKRLSKVEDVYARNLLSLMLHKDPSQRPPCLNILGHPFISGVHSSRLAGEDATYDVFISYRVASDGWLASMLYQLLIAQDLRVWWDQACLKPGEPWEEGFCNGMVCSCTFVPIISKGGMKAGNNSFESLHEESPCDNLLLEFKLALELRARHMMSKIYPVFVGSPDSNGNLQQYGFGVNESSDFPVCVDLPIKSIDEKFHWHLERQGFGLPIGEFTTVRSIVKGITACQGGFVSGSVEASLALIVSQIVEMVRMTKT